MECSVFTIDPTWWWGGVVGKWSGMLPTEDGTWTSEDVWQTEWLEFKGDQLTSQGGVESMLSLELFPSCKCLQQHLW